MIGKRVKLFLCDCKETVEKFKKMVKKRELYDYYELLDNFDLGEKHMRV